MKTIILNETEIGRLCAQKIDSRIDLTLHLECYPDEDSDIYIEFTVEWIEISPPEKFSGEALPHFEGKYSADITIYRVEGLYMGQPVKVIYSEEALKEQIENNLN